MRPTSSSHTETLKGRDPNWLYQIVERVSTETTACPEQISKGRTIPFESGL